MATGSSADYMRNLSNIVVNSVGANIDTGANNIYDVVVMVSDGTLTDTQAIVVTVTPANDNAPVIGSNGGGAAAGTQDELWPEADGYFKLGGRFRLYTHARLTYSPASWTEDGTSSFQEIEAASGFDITIKPILHHGLKKPVWERERYLERG